ncbi:MAG: MarR family winged helix-turn-helix transcriptional regulator [Candidatus Thiodiazotropha endolucinida]
MSGWAIISTSVKKMWNEMKKPGTTPKGRLSFGWQIQMLARIIESGMQDRLDPLGLTIPEFTCLMALLEGEGSTQTDLGRITGAPEYATSRTVEKLVQANLVERLPHPTSRRAHQIHFTKKGKALAIQLPGLIKANNDHILGGLSKTQRAQLEGLLRQTLDHIADSVT